jgi:RNA-splicing ligase RtcB
VSDGQPIETVPIRGFEFFEPVACGHAPIKAWNHGVNFDANTSDLGIIPGSMGTGSFIVRGRGNPDSFCSCSHGAGRRMSRTEAKKKITLADHVAATAHVECRKDVDAIDESPAASAVIAAQTDLIVSRINTG